MSTEENHDYYPQMPVLKEPALTWKADPALGRSSEMVEMDAHAGCVRPGLTASAPQGTKRSLAVLLGLTSVLPWDVWKMFSCASSHSPLCSTRTRIKEEQKQKGREQGEIRSKTSYSWKEHETKQQ